MVSITLFKCAFADVVFALYVMFVIWHWLERGQSGLFIQLYFTASVFFSAITSSLI